MEENYRQIDQATWKEVTKLQSSGFEQAIAVFSLT